MCLCESLKGSLWGLSSAPFPFLQAQPRARSRVGGIADDLSPRQAAALHAGQSPDLEASAEHHF